MSKMNFHTNLSVYLWATSGICVWMIIEEYCINILNIEFNTGFRIYLFIVSIVLVALSVYIDDKYLEKQELKGDSN